MERTRRRRTTEINAVHEDDLRAFLDCYGLISAFDAGTLRCASCDESLMSAGVGAARERDGILVLACACFECMRELT